MRPVAIVLGMAIAVAGCTAAASPSVSPGASASATGSPVAAATMTASPAVSPSVAPASASPSAVPSAPPAPTATPDLSSCPTDQAGNLALATALNRTLVLADGRSTKFSTASVMARNGSWGGDDAIPAFATLDLKMTPDKATSNGTYVIAGSSGMTLTGGVARAYQRSQLSGTNGPGVTIKGSPQPLEVTVVDGKLVLKMPTSADTWVIDLTPQWQTACLKGDGAAYPLVTTP